jgi:phosphate transport system substrate-binding protein
MRKAIYWSSLFLAIGLIALPGCDDNKSGGANQIIKIDGSSTVFPINEAMAEEFQKKHDARVTIRASGTGGGFKKFCRGKADIIGASRPVTDVEAKKCAKQDIDYIELPIAYDGVAVVVHPSNDWATKLTVSDLKKMWSPDAQGEVTKWSQIRDEWPDKPLNLYGAGIDSGTYDYFTHAVVGKAGASRGDFTSSEDDNVLVKGVSSDKTGLAFFGFAYYEENADKLKLAAIGESKDGPFVKPSRKTISTATYQPLTRPLFIYVRKDVAKRKNVQEFVDYYLNEGTNLVDDVGYVSLPDKTYGLVEKRFRDRTTGSMFSDGAKIGVSVEDLLTQVKGEAPSKTGDKPEKKKAEEKKGKEGSKTKDDSDKAKDKAKEENPEKEPTK